MNRIIGFLIAVGLCWATVAYAGDERRGTAGAQFLRIAPDARAVGMGSAAIALTNNANALYWNPAGVTGLSQTDLAFTHLNYLLDINYDFVGIVHPVSEYSMIGFSIGILSVGDIEVTTVDAPDGTGATFSPYDVVIGFSYGRRMTDRISIGVTAKYIRESIDQLAASGLAGDIGFQYNTGLEGLKFGIAMTNFGPRMRFSGEQLNVSSSFPGAPSDAEEEVYTLVADSFELPSELKVGIAYDVLQGRNEKHHLLFSVDGIHPNFAGDRVNFGAEAKFNNLLFGRIGYSAADQSNFTEGLSGGVGLQFDVNDIGLRVDYSYSDRSELGNNQRVSVGLSF
jgi:hypothetical protein